MLDENELTEIEVEDGERRIGSRARPRRRRAAAAAAPAAAPRCRAPPLHGKEDSAPPASSRRHAVKSPMVGTAYLSPEPGAAPFIGVGKTVKAGDTLLIVEAMKVMNPITAPERRHGQEDPGRDAQPVEFDQPLVIID